MPFTDDGDIVLQGADAQDFINSSLHPDIQKIERRDRFMDFVSANCTITDGGDCFSIIVPDTVIKALAFVEQVFAVESEYRPIYPTKNRLLQSTLTPVSPFCLRKFEAVATQPKIRACKITDTWQQYATLSTDKHCA
ncbi:MAG: hypothetical protein LIO58_02335 [Oscillospiraceae bacterium]|nr:hypothetical protein [Oscillospiraceae bacterium]